MHSIKVIDKNHDDVIVVFSYLGTEKGKFGYYKNVIDLPFNIIFVNDYANNWYLSGTPEFISSLDFIQYLLKKIYSLKSIYGSLFVLGSSMGGYGALKYGALLQADNKILAFVPEVELFIENGRSNYIRNKINFNNRMSIKNLYFKNSKNVYILSSGHDIVDLYSSSEFYKFNHEMNIKVIANQPHNIMSYIHNDIGLNNLFIDYFVNAKTTYLDKWDSPIEARLANSLKSFSEKLNNGIICLRHKEDILKIKNIYSKWAIIDYYLGHIYYSENHFMKSISSFSNALVKKKDYMEALYFLIKYYVDNRLNIERCQFFNDNIYIITFLSKIIKFIPEQYNTLINFDSIKYKEINFSLLEENFKDKNWIVVYILYRVIDTSTIQENNLDRYYYILGVLFREFKQNKKSLSFFAKSLSYNKQPNNALMQYATLIFSLHSHKPISKEIILKEFKVNKYNIKTISFNLIYKWFKSGYYKGCIVASLLFDKSILDKHNLSKYYYFLSKSYQKLDYFTESSLYYAKSLECNEKPNDSLMGYASLLHDYYHLKEIDYYLVLKPFSNQRYKFENISMELIQKWYKSKLWKGVHIACLLFNKESLSPIELKEYHSMIENARKKLGRE